MSINDYNRQHYGKAWRIVAVIRDGGAYCLDCLGHGDVEDETLTPVFASDDYAELYCEGCYNGIEGM